MEIWKFCACAPPFIEHVYDALSAYKSTLYFWTCQFFEVVSYWVWIPVIGLIKMMQQKASQALTLLGRWFDTVAMDKNAGVDNGFVVPEAIFAIKACPKQFIGVNTVGALFGGLALYLIFRNKNDVKTKTFLMLWGILIAYMLADALVWRVRGVREIEIDAGGFKIRRGRGKELETYRFDQVSDFHVHTRYNRKSVQILLGEKVLHVPGIITLYPGRKIWITNDAFDSKEFDFFIERMEQGLGRAKV